MAPVPGYGPPSVQMALTLSDSIEIRTTLSDAMPYARGLNVSTAGTYKITDLAGHDTTVYLVVGYNPCPCRKVWATGAASASGVVACY